MTKKKKKLKRRKTKTGKKSRFPKKLLLLFFFAALFLGLFYLKQQSAMFSPEGNPADASVKKVIDVSKWEGKINWNKVKDYGVYHAILKIGSGDYDGTGFNEDPLFHANYKNAVKEDIQCGIYFFSYAVTPEEAKKEALYCLDLLKKHDIQPKDLTFPVAFDIEYKKALATGKRNCTDMAVAFCETIKEAGYEPMIYSSASYLKNNLIYSEIKDYKLWVANYKAEGPAWGKPYVMWQYSETGKVPGVSGGCDMNYWYSDFIKVKDIESESRNLTINEGKTKIPEVKIIPENATNKRLIWSSYNSRIVEIINKQTGEMKGIKKGSTYITVRTPSGIKNTIKVTVK